MDTPLAFSSLSISLSRRTGRGFLRCVEVIVPREEAAGLEWHKNLLHLL